MSWRWTDERGVQRLVSGDELRQALKNGLIPPATLVWRQGMAAWAPAFTVPELANAALSPGPITSEAGERRSRDTPTEVTDVTDVMHRDETGAVVSEQPGAAPKGEALPKGEASPKGEAPPKDKPPTKPMATKGALGGKLKADASWRLKKRPPMKTLRGLEGPDEDRPSTPHAPIVVPSSGGTQEATGPRIITQLPRYGVPETVSGSPAIPKAPKVPSGAGTVGGSGKTSAEIIADIKARIAARRESTDDEEDTLEKKGDGAPAGGSKLTPVARSVATSKSTPPPPAVRNVAAPARGVTKGTSRTPSSSPPAANKPTTTPPPAVAKPRPRSVPPPPVRVKPPSIPPRAVEPAPRRAPPPPPVKVAPRTEVAPASESSALAGAVQEAAAAVAASGAAFAATTPGIGPAGSETSQAAAGPGAASDVAAVVVEARGAGTEQASTAEASVEVEVVAEPQPLPPIAATPVATGFAVEASATPGDSLAVQSALPVHPALVAPVNSTPEVPADGLETLPLPPSRGPQQVDSGRTWGAKGSLRLLPSDAVQVPMSSLMAVGGALIFMVITSFFAGRCSVSSPAVVPTARTALHEASVIAKDATPSVPKPCWVARQPKRWAPLVEKSIPFEVGSNNAGTFAIGYARDPLQAVGIDVDPATGVLKQQFTQSARSKIEVVSPAPHAEEKFIVTTEQQPGLRSLVHVPAEKPMVVGLTEGAVAIADRADGTPTTLWPIAGSDGLEAPRVTVAGKQGYTFTFRRENVVWGGWIGADRKPLGELTKVNGSGGAVGKPSSGWNGRESAIIFADKPAGGRYWEIRVGHATPGTIPSFTQIIPLPDGGPGGDAFAPDIAGLPDGRWVLIWTEGPAGSRALRAQTLGPDLSPIGDPIALSPPAGNFGQGILGVSQTYVGAVFLSKPAASYELWGVILQCG